MYNFWLVYHCKYSSTLYHFQHMSFKQYRYHTIQVSGHAPYEFLHDLYIAEI